MSTWTDKRNGTYMGEPSDIGRHPTPGRGSTAGKNGGNGSKSASFKNGSILKGMPAHETGQLPKLPGYSNGGKEQRNSTIGKGSI